MLRSLLLSSALFSETVLANGFIAGTPIRTVDSYKSIDQICEGDIVLACDTSYCTPQKVITDAKVHGSVDIYNVTTVDGNSVYASELQTFYVLNQGWTKSCDLEIGDKIIHSEQGAMEVSLINKIRRPQVTYNFDVEYDHGYFSIGLLTK